MNKIILAILMVVVLTGCSMVKVSAGLGYRAETREVPEMGQEIFILRIHTIPSKNGNSIELEHESGIFTKEDDYGVNKVRWMKQF